MLTDENADATFIKPSFFYIQNADALAMVTADVFPNAVQWSSDTQANAMAALDGVTVLERGKFGKSTLKRLKENSLLPSALDKYGERKKKLEIEMDKTLVQKVSAECPSCDHKFVIEVDA